MSAQIPDSVVETEIQQIKNAALLIDDLPLRYAWLGAVHNAIETGDLSPLHELTRFHRKPVHVVQFVEDPYYLGLRGEVTMKSMALIEECFSTPRVRVIFAGAQGYGKDFMARIMLAYVLYRVSCLRTPQRDYGLASFTSLFFFAQSLTVSLARKVIFDQFARLIRKSPYFREKFIYDPQVQTELRFPNAIQVIPIASHEKAAFGMDVLGGIMDEMNFLPVNLKSVKVKGSNQTWDQAVANHNAVLRRIRQRFTQSLRDHSFPGLLILLSSRNYPGDFIDREIEAAYRLRSDQGDETTFVVDLPSWGTANPGKYSSTTFRVEVGDVGRTSRILNDQEEPMPGARVLDVPVDLKVDFERDIDACLRDYGGVSTLSIKPFFRRRDLVAACMRSDLKHPLSHALTDFESQELVVFPEAFDLKNPRPRFCHLDLSKNQDATGLCILHVSGWQTVTKRSGDDENEQITEVWPEVTIDLLLKIIAPPNNVIDYQQIRRLLYTLRDDAKLPIKYVTFDQFQSLDSQVQLRKRGFLTGEISVEKRRPYILLRNAVYDGRLRSPQYDELIRELVQLEDLIEQDRVDHPPAQQGGCFVGETRIPLLDGTIPTISELVDREVWIYASLEDGTIAPGIARGRVTMEVTELVDVVLDSGAVVRCTPGHRWRLLDGTYKEAVLLRPGLDRLMPITRTWPVNGGYERVCDQSYTKRLTHHMVYEFFHGPLAEGFYVHHVNGVKTDNRPENLEAIDWREHARHHTTERHRIDPVWREKLYEGAQRFNLSAGGRKKHSEALKRTMSGVSKTEYLRRARLRVAFRSDVTLESLQTVRDDPAAVNANSVAQLLGCGRNVVVRVLREHGFTSWAQFRGQNHKVRMVIPVQLRSAVPVYDLEVDEFSNFALSAGVFVHNSKDLADALCGAYYNLIMRRETWIEAGQIPTLLLETGKKAKQEE